MQSLLNNKTYRAHFEKDKTVSVLDLAIIRGNVRKWKKSFGSIQAYYAIKANPAREVLQVMAEEGLHFDAASQQELELLQSIDPKLIDKVVYSNTSKSITDIKYAYKAGVRMFVSHSQDDLDNISEYAPDAKVLLRVTTECGDNVQFPHKGRFGIPHDKIHDVLRNNRHLRIVGFHVHHGSENRDPEAWSNGIRSVANLFVAHREQYPELRIFDISGGYASQNVFLEKKHPDIAEYGRTIHGIVERTITPDVLQDIKIIAEPGRALVSNAQVMMSRISEVKRHDMGFLATTSQCGLNTCGLAEPGVTAFIARADDEGEYHIIHRPGDHGRKTAFYDQTCDDFPATIENHLVPHDIRKGDVVLFYGTGAYCTQLRRVAFNGQKSPIDYTTTGDIIRSTEFGYGFPEYQNILPQSSYLTSGADSTFRWQSLNDRYSFISNKVPMLKRPPIYPEPTETMAQEDMKPDALCQVLTVDVNPDMPSGVHDTNIAFMSDCAIQRIALNAKCHQDAFTRTSLPICEYPTGVREAMEVLRGHERPGSPQLSAETGVVSLNPENVYSGNAHITTNTNEQPCRFLDIDHHPDFSKEQKGVMSELVAHAEHIEDGTKRALILSRNGECRDGDRLDDLTCPTNAEPQTYSFISGMKQGILANAANDAVQYATKDMPHRVQQVVRHVSKKGLLYLAGGPTLVACNYAKDLVQYISNKHALLCGDIKQEDADRATETINRATADQQSTAEYLALLRLSEGTNMHDALSLFVHNHRNTSLPAIPDMLHEREAFLNGIVTEYKNKKELPLKHEELSESAVRSLRKSLENSNIPADEHDRFMRDVTIHRSYKINRQGLVSDTLDACETLLLHGSTLMHGAAKGVLAATHYMIGSLFGNTLYNSAKESTYTLYNTGNAYHAAQKCVTSIKQSAQSVADNCKASARYGMKRLHGHYLGMTQSCDDGSVSQLSLIYANKLDAIQEPMAKKQCIRSLSQH